MAFGIPNSDGGTGNGEFLSRLQYDARVGFWKVVKRVQGPNGYENEEGQPVQSVAMAMDFGSLEVGYNKMSSPPVFMLVPFGQPIPPQPEEMSAPDAQGKTRKAFQPGFRIKVCGQKLFGDMDAYYFSSTSKNVLGPMDTLHGLFLKAPEAAQGKIPVVKSAKSTAIKQSNKYGNSTFYSPEFEIVQWVDRPECLGERLVPVPGGGLRGSTAPQAAQPARHVPPPAPRAAEPELEEADMPF